jgi:hypothetical protein
MDIDLVNDLRRTEEESDDDVDNIDDNHEKRKKFDDESKNVDVEKMMKKASEVAKQKVARRPRPKLDVDRYVR